MRRLLATLFLLLTPASALAQQVVTSARPERLQVTVYRNPQRGSEPLNLNWLEGYALISETRRLTLPAGISTIRFQGVAGDILPQSAILTGLPEDVVERNQDAYLLSPGTLLDRSLGRRVTLRRTDRATGRVIEQQALVRSGADGAVVLQTPAGFEALRCTGGAETLVYPEVPAELSAKPTLSVRVRSSKLIATTVTLSYLAAGFDWQANYIGKLSSDGTRMRLFAWLTLASMDETSFPDAQTQAVAGRLNRESANSQEPVARALQLQCWPSATTSDVPPIPPPPPPPPAMAAPPPPPPMPERGGGEDIIVTGARVMAQREGLGDVKLYRLPEPVTVAANSQKQVALLEQPAVKVQTVFRAQIDAEGRAASQPTLRLLRTRNRAAEGLGLPLPAGQIALFGERNGQPLLLGEGRVRDLAIGEDVEIALEQTPGVRTELIRVATDRVELTATNDSPAPVRYEAELYIGDGRQVRADQPLVRKDGKAVWSTEIPANGTRRLRYRLTD